MPCKIGKAIFMVNYSFAVLRAEEGLLDSQMKSYLKTISVKFMVTKMCTLNVLLLILARASLYIFSWIITFHQPVLGNEHNERKGLKAGTLLTR